MSSLNEVLHKIVDLHNPDRRLPLHRDIDVAVQPEKPENTDDEVEDA